MSLILDEINFVLQFFHQFDSISKWVKHMGTFVSIQWRLGFVGFVSDDLNIGDQYVEIVYDESGVCFACRSEIGFDTEMHLYPSRFKPGAAALSEFGRFGDLLKAKHVNVERARLFFLSGGHGDLNVVNG